MRLIHPFAAIAAIGLLTASGPARAGDAMPMGAMPMGPMSMGLAMPAMPALYGGQADKPGRAGVPGPRRAPASDLDAQSRTPSGSSTRASTCCSASITPRRSARSAKRRGWIRTARCAGGASRSHSGPNINLPMPDDAVAPAWAGAAERARALEAKATPEERDWIETLAAALQRRSQGRPPGARRGLRRGDGRALARPPGRPRRRDLLRRGDDGHPAVGLWQADGVTPKGHAADIVATLEDVIRRAPEASRRACISTFTRWRRDHARAGRGGGRPAVEADAGRRPHRAHAFAHLLPRWPLRRRRARQRASRPGRRGLHRRLQGPGLLSGRLLRPQHPLPVDLVRDAGPLPGRRWTPRAGW